VIKVKLLPGLQLVANIIKAGTVVYSSNNVR